MYPHVCARTHTRTREPAPLAYTPRRTHAYNNRILGCYSAPGMSFFVLPSVLHFARIVISKITRYLETSLSRDLEKKSLVIPLSRVSIFCMRFLRLLRHFLVIPSICRLSDYLNCLNYLNCLMQIFALRILRNVKNSEKLSCPCG